MTVLKFEKYNMPAAPLGEDSTLPDIHVNNYIRAKIDVSERVSGEDAKYVGKGVISTLIPYSIQDGYSRERQVRGFDAAILENEYLRAVFITEIGGRLWSLYDKKRNVELLYKNDVFQPANLALRNAWFSGGVEWNVGIKGHNPLTCSPLFAQKLVNKHGEPVLRMYEYERIRGVTYAIEATLKDDALVMNMTVENTAEKPVYMYWWSNIAVPETPDTRVITPAKEAFYCGYTDGAYLLDKASVPFIEGRDITYSANSYRSRDFFFDIPDEKEKFVAAINGEGRGLLQFSDPILKGRKLFVWGQHQGGKRWNEWLSQDAGGYIEIQAGLLKTQLEHFIMPEKSTINWRECYCTAEIDPKIAHGELFEAAELLQSVVVSKKDKLDPSLFEIAREEALTYYGSGWGALEAKLRGTAVSHRCSFPEDSITAEQRDWKKLIDEGVLPEHDPEEKIASHVAGERWIALMEAAPREDWYYYERLGVMKYANGESDEAKRCFERSIELCDNAWARRNLAQLYKGVYGDLDSAADNMIRALELKRDYLPLVIEFACAMLRAKREKLFIEVYETLDEKIKQNGRIKMLLGECYSNIGDTDAARRYINAELVVPDLMEGEYSLSNIWLGIYSQVLAKERGVKRESLSAEEVYEAYPLPRELDFRMH